MSFSNIRHTVRQNNKDHYLSLVALHIVFAFLLHFVPVFSDLYFFGTILYFSFKIFTAPHSSKFKEVVIACCYIVGSEVLFRMTGGTFFYEAAKYLVIIYVLMGLFSTGFSNKSYIYFIYILLLLPSILVAYMNASYSTNLRTNIAFVLSGPVCLGISAIYLYDKKIKMNDLLHALKFMSFPIIAMTVYLFLYSPSIKDVLRGTQSNFEASGGFGPNQVATILGLGMFALAVRLFIKSPTLFLKIINLLLLGVISYRGIVTFSRGGIITAILIICAFLVMLYRKSSTKQKGRIVYTLIIFGLLAVSVWTISSNQTEGLIDKRYANQDKLGREKEDLSTGRVELFLSDIQGFVENPFLGIGANGAKELRLKSGEGLKASHNEISRLLSEHGILAFIILSILLFRPLAYRLNNNRNIFFFAFLGFWFATINHSAMRLSAPGFIYALSLLNVQYEKRPLRRKRIIKKG